MEQSDRLSLSYVMDAQAQKHVTVNETTRALDALVHMAALSRAVAAEPASPTAGDGYILPSGKTGAAWAAMTDNAVAVYQDNAWMEYLPVVGMTLYVQDEAAHYVWNGTAWTVTATGGGGGGSQTQAPTFGVNTSADSTNKLSVKSDAVLHSHDDVTPGSGDVRHILNKSVDTGTASHLFQTAFSARAEFGLTGTDDFVIKVSPDGSTFFDAMIIDRTTGAVSFPNTPNLGVTDPPPPPPPVVQTPDELANLAVWYDPSDAAARVLNGSLISQLTDKSGANIHAVQSNSGRQPTLSVGTFGGRDALTFSGSEHLELDALAPVFAGEDIPYSLHIAFQAIGTVKVLFSATSSSIFNTINWFGVHADSTFRMARRDDGGGSAHVDFLPTDETAHVASLIFDGTQLSVWWDGVKIAENITQNVGSLSADLVTLGTLRQVGNPLYGFEGQVGELCVYDRANTDEEVRSLQRYLGNRWIGLPEQADLVLAIGQSNMKGRGDSSASPSVPNGTAFGYLSNGLFRSLQDPVGEGNSEADTGSLLPAFANTWRTTTGRSVICVPKAVGGTVLLPAADSGAGNWEKSSGTLYYDAIGDANAALAAMGQYTAFTVGETYVLWAQGESDAIALNAGTSGVSASSYQSALESIVANLNADLSSGLDHFFLFELGVLANDPTNASWTAIRDAQGLAMGNVSLGSVVATSAKTFHTTGRMKADNLHWNQTGLNDIGAEGATNGATIIGS